MFELRAKSRKIFGKKVKFLRKQGQLPAILYGPNTKTQPLEINYKDFEKIYVKVGESSILKLKVGDQEKKVLIKDIQKDPLNNKFLHIDFYEVPLEEKIKLKVPLEFLGESVAVKSLGGTLVKNILELEIETLPENLPKSLKVDLSKLQTFEDNIKVGEIEVPPMVKVLTSQEEIIASVIPPLSEKELEEIKEKPKEEVEKVEKVEKREEAETP